MTTQALLPDRFAAILDGLCRAVAARMARNPAAVPLLLLLWGRLRRVMRRFASLAERARTNTLPRPRARPASLRRQRQRERLPEGFAWLVRLVPEAAVSGSQLQHLLTDPECAALLAATPQAGRIFRPLCRMLGAQPIPALLPPASARRPAKPRPPVQPARPAVRPRRPGKPILGSFRLARLFAPL